MKQLSEETFRNAFALVNKTGFAVVDLRAELPDELGASLYHAMDSTTFHPGRSKYYNEIAFFWPEDWQDVEEGIGSFHEPGSVKNILPIAEADKLMKNNLGDHFARAIYEFASRIKHCVVASHFGLLDNTIKLARVMVRQMNEGDHTLHRGSDFHEDVGYDDRPYQQLLSVIITTHGIPTVAHRHKARVGELVVFNAFDRRRLLGLPDELAFIDRGPKTGPKMFFFFEFLGPRD